MLAIRPGPPKTTSARRNVSSYSGYAKPTKANSRRLQKWRWIFTSRSHAARISSRHRRRAGIILNEKTFGEPSDDLVGQPWMGRGMPSGNA